MGSRVEILDSGGFRSDGRKQYELRDFNIDLWSPSASSADGSATVSHGLTQVQVNVFGPREPRLRSQSLHDRLFVNVEVSIAPFSSSERRTRGRGDKRIMELAAAIKNTFDPVVQKHLYPRSELDIYVQVLQQDGGVLQTCINATTAALITAGIPLVDFVCGVTVGVHTTDVLLDLTNLEENDVPHLTIATMPRSGKVTLVSMETRLNVERFGEMMALGRDAGKVVGEEMKDVVRAWGEERMKTQRLVP